MTSHCFMFGMIILIASPVVATADAPTRLRGKSVVVSWSESRIQRHVGEVDFKRVEATLDMSVYVSTVGRVFSRFSPTTRAGTASSDQIQGQPNAAPNSRPRVPTFSEQSMTLFQPFLKGGMRRVTVTFNETYQNCRAKVAYAKEEGARTSFANSPITKQVVEFQSLTASGEACTVVNGNVFNAGH